MIGTLEQQKESEYIAKLSIREKIALDAYIFNPSNKIDCYLIAKGLEDSADNQNIDVLRERANKWLGLKGPKAYLKISRTQILAESQTQLSDNENFEGMNKQNAVYLLEQMIKKTTNELNKAKLIEQLSKIQGWQKEKADTEDDTVRYYLPLRCSDCEFKKTHVPD